MSKTNKTTEVVHFKVHGEFITRTARNLWAEGNEDKALKLLVTGLHEMTEAIAVDICAGRSKLVGVNNDIKLKSDKATTDSRNLPLPQSIVEVLKKKLKDLEAEKEEKAHIIQSAIRSLDDEDWHDKLEQNEESGEFKSSIPTIVRKLAGEDLPETIEPDESLMANTGWLSPDGKLYECEYYEHIALISRLVKHGEGKAEKLGWKKLQNNQWFYMPNPDLTQPQVDSMFDWCQKHEKDMPKWALGEEDD